MLENDLMLERFFAHHGTTVTQYHAQGLHALMELPDNDLLDLLLARKQATGKLAVPEVRDVLTLVRHSYEPVS